MTEGTSPVPEENVRPNTLTTVDRLHGESETLFYENPSVIADKIRAKLIKTSQDGLEVEFACIIPDYHSFSGQDGGVKDVLFGTKPGLSKQINWETTTVLGNDGKTMYGLPSSDIQAALQNKVRELEAEGYTVRHVIPIIDSHRKAFVEGVGGLDGTKDFIICCHK